MKTAKEMRAQAKTLADEAEAITKLEGDMTDEQRTEFDAKLAESDTLIADAERMEALAERQAKLDAGQGHKTPVVPDTPETRTQEEVAVMHTARGKLTDAWGVTEEARGQNAHDSGQFLLAHLWQNEKAQRYCDEHGIIYRAMGTGVAGSGGVLVPDQFESTLIALMNSYGNAMQECRVVPLGAGTNYVPRRISGTTTYFVAEGGTATASDAALDNISLTAKDAINLTRVHDNLVSDGVIDIANFIATEHALSLTTKVDACVIDGDGSQTYGGMHGVRAKMVDGNHAASYNDATAGDDQWGEYLLADIQGIEGLLPNWAHKRGNVKWHVSRVCYHSTFRRLLSAAGGNAWPDIVAGGGGNVNTFLGYPVAIWDAMPSASTAYNETVVMLFGNMMDAITIGVQRGATVMETAHRYFEFSQIGIKTTMRFDINVHDIGDASNAGAVVGLRGNTS